MHDAGETLGQVRQERKWSRWPWRSRSRGACRGDCRGACEVDPREGFLAKCGAAPNAVARRAA
jgi:hypothetical protein